jgi:hypothetical protein
VSVVRIIAVWSSSRWGRVRVRQPRWQDAGDRCHVVPMMDQRCERPAIRNGRPRGSDGLRRRVEATREGSLAGSGRLRAPRARDVRARGGDRVARVAVRDLGDRLMAHGRPFIIRPQGSKLTRKKHKRTPKPGETSPICSYLCGPIQHLANDTDMEIRRGYPTDRPGDILKQLQGCGSADESARMAGAPRGEPDPGRAAPMIQGRDLGDENDARARGGRRRASAAPMCVRGATFTSRRA